MEKLPKISEVGAKEIEDFSGDKLIYEGFTFNYQETYRKAKLYKRGLYTTPQPDGTLFWKLGNKREPHFKKHIDFDTKNFIPYGEGSINFLQSFVAKLEFKKWAHDTKLPKDLNNLVEKTGAFGLHFWKKVPIAGTHEKYEVQDCKLDRLYFDITEFDDKKRTIIEEHPVNEAQALEMAEFWGGEENVRDALEVADKVSDSKYNGTLSLEKYKFFERCGYFKVAIDEKKGREAQYEYKYMHHIYAGHGDKEVILFEEEVDESIYYSFNLGDNDDVIMSSGIYERLFDLYEYANDLVNYNQENNAIASLLVLMSEKSGLRGVNALSDLETGVILDDPSLKALQINNNYLNEFLAQLARIENEADQLCMTPNVIRGENLPASTTFRGQAGLTNAAKDAFKTIRDDIADKVIHILLDVILPANMKDWNAEHLLDVMDDEQDIAIYDEYFTRIKLQKKAQDYIDEHQAFPNMELVQEWKQNILNDHDMNGRKIEVKDGFFKFGIGIKIQATNEGSDKSQKNDVYVNAIQWTQQDPAVNANPYFRQMLEDNGITPIKLKPPTPQPQQQQQQQKQQQLSQPKQGDKLMNLIDSN